MHSLVFSTTLDEYISSFPALYNISLPHSTAINTSLFIIGFVLGDPAYRVRSLGSLSHMAVGLINTLLWVWIGIMCDMSRGGSLTTQLAPSGGSGSFGGGVCGGSYGVGKGFGGRRRAGLNVPIEVGQWLRAWLAFDDFHFFLALLLATGSTFRI